MAENRRFLQWHVHDFEKECGLGDLGPELNSFANLIAIVASSFV